MNVGPCFCVVDGAKKINAEIIKEMRELIISEYPLYPQCRAVEKTGKHDYEPNISMDYFRCDSCGIRPKMHDFLEKIK